MTRGYFVLEMKGLLHAAALMSDAYLEGYGKEIIEAFLNNNEERLLDTLRAKMNEKDRTEMDRYICPEWYRITKKSEAKDYIAEYGYVISAEKLKIYNNGKLLITMDKITAKEWLYLIDHRDKTGEYMVGSLAFNTIFSRIEPGSEKDFFEEHRYRSNDFFILSRTAIALGLLPLEDSDGKDLIIGVDNEEAKEALLGEHAFELKLGKNDWVEYSFTLTDNIIKVINYEKMSKLYDFDII